MQPGTDLLPCREDPPPTHTHNFHSSLCFPLSLSLRWLPPKPAVNGVLLHQPPVRLLLKAASWRVPLTRVHAGRLRVARMLDIVDAVDKDRTGGFFDWDGKAVPW